MSSRTRVADDFANIRRRLKKIAEDEDRKIPLAGDDERPKADAWYSGGGYL